ncbi:ethanolamine utilization protein EutN [Siculibacillus lacustris]|uniref:Ethanolamine utilization protein EutN n=1 Tax=Siculibacillus lacustris TaxID=1549641 RepID=A0A4Q9VN14_9HYPH|nr:EutN/CcmL family microcompartment protein [Siculibacillus lacustris]TBW36775.1 ethanolamine utilization protein EutN [Siculibacillus lacustris]
MQLARVVGTVVATRKEETLIGFKFLVLEILDAGRGNAVGSSVVAVDTLGAGVGDEVLFVTGGGARCNLKPGTPIDAAIIGIVDSVDVRS